MKIETWARENRLEASVKAFSLVAAVALLALSSYALAANPPLLANKWVEGAVIGGSALIALAIVGHTLHKLNKRADTPKPEPAPVPPPRPGRLSAAIRDLPLGEKKARLTHKKQIEAARLLIPLRAARKILRECDEANPDGNRQAMENLRQRYEEIVRRLREKRDQSETALSYACMAEIVLGQLATADMAAPDPVAAAIISREGINIVWDYAEYPPSQDEPMNGRFQFERTDEQPRFTYYPLAMSTGGRHPNHACAILVDHSSHTLYYYDPMGPNSSYNHIPSADNGHGQPLQELIQEMATRHDVQSTIRTSYRDQRGVGCTVFCICWVLDMARGQRHEEGLSDRERRDRVAHEICDFALDLFD